MFDPTPMIYSLVITTEKSLDMYKSTKLIVLINLMELLSLLFFYDLLDLTFCAKESPMKCAWSHCAPEISRFTGDTA